MLVEHPSARVAEERIKSSAERAIKFLVVMVLVGLLLGYALLSFPSRRDTLDFAQFYAAGQMVRQGLGRDLYDFRVQGQFQSKLARVHTFYSHPPFEALLFVPLTYTNYRAAYAIWFVGSLGLLAWTVFLIESRTKISSAILEYTRIN